MTDTNVDTRTATQLRMSGISKAFPGVQALDDVSFEARGGEIVGLVGVNGAGKSTLMNVLGGIYQPERGDIYIDGRKVVLQSPKDAGRQGIAFIHQELLFFASQTVAENMFISNLFPHPSLPLLVSKKAAIREAGKYLEMLGSTIDPASRMEDLSVGERQVVEIARALAMGSRFVILDEPTSSLSLKEKRILFELIKRMKEEGKAVIYISHFLDEIFELCDKYIVLRNGRVNGQGDVADVTKNDIVKLIIGKELVVADKVYRAIEHKPVLKVENIRREKVLRDVSFELHESEILGLWGLMGSGRTELVRAMLGLDRIDGGGIFLATADGLAEVSPRQLLRQCGYITENRHADGLFLTQPVWTNITATALRDYASRLLRFMDMRHEIATAIDFIKSMRIATPGHATRVENLSGGNQQKVVFAKWLNRKDRVLIMDEPTRGVDVGAKLEIGALIRQRAHEGTSTLLISSEIEEIVNLSDRVLILKEGRIVGDVSGEEINNQTLMRYALGEETVDA